MPPRRSPVAGRAGETRGAQGTPASSPSVASARGSRSRPADTDPVSEVAHAAASGAPGDQGGKDAGTPSKGATRSMDAGAMEPCSSSAGRPGESPVEVPQITIRIKGQDSDECVTYTVKPTASLEKVFNMYAKKKGREAAGIKFYRDGADGSRVRLSKTETVQSAGLQELDVIDALTEQTAG